MTCASHSHHLGEHTSFLPALPASAPPLQPIPGCSQVACSSRLLSVCPHCFGSLAGPHCLSLMAFHYLTAAWFLYGVVQVSQHGLLFHTYLPCQPLSIKHLIFQKLPLVPWARGRLCHQSRGLLPSQLSLNPHCLYGSLGHLSVVHCVLFYLHFPNKTVKSFRIGAMPLLA